MERLVHVGDRVQTRKPHPCGSDLWTVFRVGADIGLRCDGCGRRVLLARSQFHKQARILSRENTPTHGDDSAP